MTTTYTIRKGHQYSATGASIVGERADGRTTWTRVDLGVGLLNGTIGDAIQGDNVWAVQDNPELLDAARATIADGQTRTVTIGQPAPVCDATTDAPASPLCPRCGTVCYGDCTAN